MNTLNKPEAHNESIELLTPEQTCGYLNLKRSMLNSLVFKNKIPVLRIGGCLRFDKADLVLWLGQKKKYSFGN